MTIKKLQQAAQEIKKYRKDIIEKLLDFSTTDLLFFWGTNKAIIKSQEEKWQPLLEWANNEFEIKLISTKGLEIPDNDLRKAKPFKRFLESLSDEELAAYYMAALNMRSILLATALIKGRINADEAFDAAYLEELEQAKVWGHDAEADKKRNEVKQELKDIEKFLRG